MTEREEMWLVRACAVASAVAALCLVVLAYLPRPPFSYSHDAIIGGAQQLSVEQTAQYLAYLRANLTFDGIYLLGYGVVIAERRRLAGAAIVAIGVASGALDLLENEIRWAVVTGLEADAASVGVGTLWRVVSGMSIWAIYVAAAVTSVALLERGRTGRLMGALGLLSAPAASLLYWRGFFFSFLWLILWHAASAVYLWRKRSQG